MRLMLGLWGWKGAQPPRPTGFTDIPRLFRWPHTGIWHMGLQETCTLMVCTVLLLSSSPSWR